MIKSSYYLDILELTVNSSLFNAFKGVFLLLIEKYTNIRVKKDVLKSVLLNIERNEQIAKFYEWYSLENGLNSSFGHEYRFRPELLERKRERLIDCNSLWFLEVFDKTKIKCFIKTNLCKDKFCHNCKKVKQASRMARYIPELELYKDNLYHLILTVPSIDGSRLKDVIKKMAYSFRRLIYLIRGDYVVLGLEWFSRLGYIGAVRSLEVTFDEQSYHPHYHIGLVLEDIYDELFLKEHVNTYSYSYGQLKTRFSFLEITIQKLWFLIYNDIKITKQTFNNLELGYSCKLNKFKPSEYQELFKYIVKGLGDESDLTYYNFKTLYESLYRVKQIQGYGCLYRIKDDDDEEMFELMYDEFIKELYEKEEPRGAAETPEVLYKDKDYLLISRKTYINYLRSIGDL